MRNEFERVLKNPVCFKEAYTNMLLGTVKPVVGGHSCSRERFWTGNLENLYDRVVEIRIRPNEIPEVYFETENSIKLLRDE